MVSLDKHRDLIILTSRAPLSRGAEAKKRYALENSRFSSFV